MNEGEGHNDGLPQVLQTPVTMDALGHEVKTLVELILGRHDEDVTFLERACLEMSNPPEWPRFPPQCYLQRTPLAPQHPQVPEQEKMCEQGSGAQVVPGL